jgi:hypothetical protein
MHRATNLFALSGVMLVCLLLVIACSSPTRVDKTYSYRLAACPANSRTQPGQGFVVMSLRQRWAVVKWQVVPSDETELASIRLTADLIGPFGSLAAAHMALHPDGSVQGKLLASALPIQTDNVDSTTHVDWLPLTKGRSGRYYIERISITTSAPHATVRGSGSCFLLLSP